MGNDRPPPSRAGLSDQWLGSSCPRSRAAWRTPPEVRTRLVQAQSGSSASFDHCSRDASGGAETEHAHLALVGELDAPAEQRVREIVGRQPPGLDVQVLDRRDQRPPVVARPPEVPERRPDRGALARTAMGAPGDPRASAGARTARPVRRRPAPAAGAPASPRRRFAWAPWDRVTRPTSPGADRPRLRIGVRIRDRAAARGWPRGRDCLRACTCRR